MDPETNHFFFPKLKKRSPPRYNQNKYNEKKSEMLLDFNNVYFSKNYQII